MAQRSWRGAATIALLLVTFGAWRTPAEAQPQRAAAAPQERVEVLKDGRVVQFPTELDQQGAEDTRQELRRLMERYPPALGRVLKLNPTLMSNPTYLAPYPALATFLQRHPEVPRYSGYFLNFIGDSNSYEPRDAQMELRGETLAMWRNIMTNITMYAVFLTVILTLSWLIRLIVGHRRWLRATKIQSEVHTRLLERFTANEELMAYVQSPAGRQFLQAAQVAPEAAASTPGIGMPLRRILMSIQAGLVLASGGVGLLYIKQYLIEEVAEMLLVFGALGVSLGVGFVLAAGTSYILSQRLGLFDALTGERRPNGA